jgi:hypothetical protein
MTGSIKRRQSGDFPRPDDLSVSSGDGDEDMAMEEGESGMSKAWVQEELAQSVQSPSSALPEVSFRRDSERSRAPFGTTLHCCCILALACASAGLTAM